MSAITAKASRKMKKYAVLAREPRCFLGSFDFSWEQRKLGELMNVTSVKRIHQSDWTDSGVRFLRARDIVSAAKNEEPDDYLYISKEKYEEYSALSGKVSVSDLLVTGVGTIGVPYLVRNLEPLYFKDGNIIWFQNSDKIDGKFLFYSFLAEQIQGFINESAGIGTVGTYTIESGKKTPISLPNQIEQAKVGAFFQQLDHLITLHQRECISFTGRAGRLILTANKKRTTSSWEQRKAKELFVSTADKGYPELPVLSATQDRGMIRRDENSINIFHDKKNEAGYKRVLPGQFVIHLRSFQGGFAHSAIEGITSPAYTVFGFSEPEKHDSEYWKYVFTSKSFIRRLETVTYGIRDGRSISYDEFLTLGFVYPSKAEQTAIARYLDKLSDLITLHQRKPFLMKWRTSDANRNQTNRLVL